MQTDVLSVKITKLYLAGVIAVQSVSSAWIRAMTRQCEIEVQLLASRQFSLEGEGDDDSIGGALNADEMPAHSIDHNRSPCHPWII